MYVCAWMCVFERMYSVLFVPVCVPVRLCICHECVQFIGCLLKLSAFILFSEKDENTWRIPKALDNNDFCCFEFKHYKYISEYLLLLFSIYIISFHLISYHLIASHLISSDIPLCASACKRIIQTFVLHRNTNCINCFTAAVLLLLFLLMGNWMLLLFDDFILENKFRQTHISTLKILQKHLN